MPFSEDMTTCTSVPGSRPADSAAGIGMLVSRFPNVLIIPVTVPSAFPSDTE